MKKFLLCALFVFFIFLFTNAQTAKIEGLIKDSCSLESIKSATIQITGGDSTNPFFATVISDENGTFKINGVPKGKRLYMKISCIGYTPFYSKLSIAFSDSVLHLTPVLLVVDYTKNKEIIINAEPPPVVMKQDTLEFRADAFSRRSTENLGGILKNMPGITFDGILKFNGQRINKILIEGQTFYSDDIIKAMKYIPSFSIDKIQIANDSSQLAPKNTKVANIILKKEAHQSAIGKILAGLGTEGRFEASANVSKFSDSSNYSTAIQKNNINKNRFDFEDMGGLIPDDGQKRTSADIDVAYSKTLRHGRISITNNFNKNKRTLINTAQETLFLNDTTLKTNSLIEYNNRETSNNTSFAYVRDWAQAIVSYSANYNYSQTNQNSSSQSNIINSAINKTGSLSNEEAVQNNGGTLTQNLDLLYTFKGKLYNKISFLQQWAIGERRQIRNIKYVNQLIIPEDSILKLDQIFKTSFNNNNYTGTLKFESRFTPAFSYIVSNEFSINTDRMERLGYANNKIEPAYMITDSLGLYKNESKLANTLTLSFKYSQEKFILSFGSGYKTLKSTGAYRNIVPSVKRTASGLQPFLLLEKGDLSVGYFYDLQLPSIEYLSTLVDKANPYNRMLGNALLKNQYTHTVYYNYSKFLFKTSATFDIKQSFVLIKNPVIFQSFVQPNGATFVYFVTGSHSFEMPLEINGQRTYVLNKKNSLTVGTGTKFNYSQAFTFISGTEVLLSSLIISPDVNISWRYNKNLYISNILSFSYVSTSAQQVFPPIRYTNYSITNNIEYSLGKDWVLKSAASFIINPNSGLEKFSLLYNAGVIYIPSKIRILRTAFKVIDLFNDNNDISRITTLNSLTELKSKVLKRYFMLSVSVDIGNRKTDPY